MTKKSSGKAPRKPLDDFIAEVIKAPGIGECSQLCDVMELERVCDLVPEAFAAARHGQVEAYGLHKTLMKNLHAPVFRFIEVLEQDEVKRHAQRLAELQQLHGQEHPIHVGVGQRMELQPSLDFLEHIEAVADHIEFGPWTDADAEACADRLRAAWYKWIAVLSSFWIWSEVPRVIASKALSRRNGRQPAQDGKPGRQRTFDHEGIRKRYAELFPSKGSGTAAIVAAQFGCTAKAVRDVIRRRGTKKNEPNPAG